MKALNKNYIIIVFYSIGGFSALKIVKICSACFFESHPAEYFWSNVFLRLNKRVLNPRTIKNASKQEKFYVADPTNVVFTGRENQFSWKSSSSYYNVAFNQTKVSKQINITAANLTPIHFPQQFSGMQKH